MNRNHLVQYNTKEEILSPMIEENVRMDKRHNDFYERFMEQRIQKINNPGQSSMKASLPFPFEPLRTAPHFHRNESVILAVILELNLLMFYPRQCQ